jgi:hypothetical protein
MVISLIVTGVAFSLYRLNASYYLREDAYLQQYQNLRVALYTIGRDVRMAGNGFALLGPELKRMQAYSNSRETLKSSGSSPPSEMTAVDAWFQLPDGTGDLGVRAIFGVDGGETDPDTLTVFRSEVESGNPLARVKSLTGNRITLDTPVLKEAIKSGDIIAIGSGSTGVVLRAGTITFSGDSTTEIPIETDPEENRFTAPSPYFPTDFPTEGAYVYNFRNVGIITYYVDKTTNSLMAAYHDSTRHNFDDAAGTSAIVASNIEDLQVYYYLDNEPVDFTKTSTTPDLSASKLNTRRVKAVSVGLEARSPYGDGPANKRRPALFNRAAGTDIDNRMRSVLIETVYLRNFNI